MYLVGIGPGPVDLLTIRAWELLASGKHLLLTSASHEVAETLGARGFSFDVINADGVDAAKLILGLASKEDEIVVGVRGAALESSLARPLHELAKANGIVVDFVEGLSDVDRLPAQDPETNTHMAPEARRAAAAFARLVSVMARLRAPGGCPWDREQTHESLAIHLLEESYETLDAIDNKDMIELEEELGDLLLQVVFHSEIAHESGAFDVAGVVEELLAKLIHRHPHVFGSTVVSGASEVVANWEAIKGEQKKRESLDEGIPRDLPALLLAHKVQRRLSGVGRDHAPTRELLAQVAEKVAVSATEQSVGELLFEIVAFAGAAGVDPESALRKHSRAALNVNNEV